MFVDGQSAISRIFGGIRLSVCRDRRLVRSSLADIAATDYLGYPIGKPGSTGVDTWGNLNSSKSGWGNWFGTIAQVCKSWHKVSQRRRSNPSHITIHDWYRDIKEWGINGGRLLREIKTSHKTYTKLRSI